MRKKTNRNARPPPMAYTSLMRYLLLALLAASSGCVIAVKDNNSPPDDPPPAPPPGTRVVVAEASETFMLKYRKRVPEVYEGIKKACDRLGIKLTSASTPGDDNWSVKGYHANGSFDLHFYLNRHDHKTQTNVTVKSGRYTQFQCREWTRKIHTEIGKQLGEDGFN